MAGYIITITIINLGVQLLNKSRRGEQQNCLIVIISISPQLKARKITINAAHSLTVPGKGREGDLQGPLRRAGGMIMMWAFQMQGERRRTTRAEGRPFPFLTK